MKLWNKEKTSDVAAETAKEKVNSCAQSGVTNADMDQIRQNIEAEVNQSSGAMSVDYAEFKQIYSYVSRYVNRNESQVQTILFTVAGKNGTALSDEVLESAMYNLNKAVVSSLRKVDVGTIFSSNQYIVILTDTDMISGQKVADRVVDEFEKLNGVSYANVTYEIQTLLAKSEHHVY